MKAVQLPSGSWNVRLRDNGKQKSFTAKTRKEVIQMASEYLYDKEHKKRNEMTVAECLDTYIDSKKGILSVTTLSLYQKIRDKNFQEIMTIPISMLTTAQVQNAISKEAETHKPKTVANMRGLLSAALKQQGITLTVSVPKPVKKIIDLPEPRQVMEAVKGKDIELPVMLAMWMGLSMSEIRGLKPESISEHYLTVCGVVVDVDGKNIEKEATKAYERTRRIQMPIEIYRLIQQTDAWRKGTGYLVPMNRRTIYGHFTKAIEDAGLPHMTFHQLRHMNASVMERLGVPLLYAKERFGHDSNSPVLMRVYQHPFQSMQQQVDDSIDAFFREQMRN